jgi:hypothetical protein
MKTLTHSNSLSLTLMDSAMAPWRALLLMWLLLMVLLFRVIYMIWSLYIYIYVEDKNIIWWISNCTWLTTLEDFNLYVFRCFQSEFKDLVTSLTIKAKRLSYADLHSHLLTHELFHKTSLQSMVVTPFLLSMPAQPPSANVARH